MKLYNLRASASVLILLLTFGSSCDAVSDRLRNFGRKSRQTAVKPMNPEEVESWKRDLKISEQEVERLHKDIHQIVEESNFQGIVAWKIAKAYMNESRYDMASRYIEGAMEGKIPSGDDQKSIRMLEDAIPYYKKALNRHIPDPELLFDAGLCFANASKNQGWEITRWKTAVLLFDRMSKIKANDSRPLYQLALLYGFTTNSDVKNTDFALELLSEIIRKEPADVPARFAKAHILAANGNFEQSRSEYVEIQNTIRDLHSSGIISGSPDRNDKYKQAQGNIDKLDDCLNGRPSCDIFR